MIRVSAKTQSSAVHWIELLIPKAVLTDALYALTRETAVREYHITLTNSGQDFLVQIKVPEDHLKNASSWTLPFIRNGIPALVD